MKNAYHTYMSNCEAAGNPQKWSILDMISVINDFDMHPNFHYNSNHDASKNTVYQVPFHSTFPISIVFLQQRKVTCLLIFPFAFYSEIFYTSGFTTTHVVVSVRHPITY